MADKIERIQILFQKRNARARGPLNSDQYNDNINELSHDLVTFIDQWNNRLVPLTDSLPNQSGSDFLDAFEDGLDGRTLYVNSEATASLDARFYNTTDDRPSSIYEKFTDIYDAIDTLEETLGAEISNFTVNALQVSISDEASLYVAQNVEQALAEVMTAVNSITVGTFDPTSISVHLRPSLDDTYTLGTSARRWADLYLGPDSLYIKSIVGDTAYSVDKTYTIGVNTATGGNAGKLEIKEGGSTILRMSSSGVSFPSGISSALNDLTDVSTAGAAANNALVYNGASWAPAAIPRQISEQSDANISTPATGQVLTYSGTKWQNTTFGQNNLSDTTISSPVTKQVLRYNGAGWVNASLLTSDLDDVDLSGLSVDDGLVWNGVDFVPRFMVSGLNDLLDVVLGSLSSDQALIYNGANWINAAIPRLLSEMGDVSISTPASGQVLKYESGTWSPADDIGVTGTGVTNELAFWTGTESIGGNTNLVWDIATSRLGVFEGSPNERLTLDGILSLGAQSTPSATAGFGKLWYETSIGALSLMDGAGLEAIVAGIATSADKDEGDLVFFNDQGLLTTSSGLNWDPENQSLVIGSDTPNPAIGLEVTKAAGPVLLPRMTQTEINALASIEGIIVYNTTSGVFQGYSGTGWVTLH